MSDRLFWTFLTAEESLNTLNKAIYLNKTSQKLVNVDIGLFEADTIASTTNQDSETVEYGQSVSNNAIDFPGEEDYYIFEGTADDIITLQLNDFSILQASQFHLYNPDGSLAIEVQPENGGIGNALLQDFDLDQTGTYLLMVSDVGGNDTGDYVFTLESVNTPGNSVPISYGESIESSLEVASDLDHYTFNGTEGDIITLQLNDFSILQASQFRLYNPDGSLAIEVQPENGGIGNALLQDFYLDQTGTYSLMVSDVGGNDTGDYVFTLESVNTPGNSVPINYGESIESSLEVASDLDHYTFNGTEGDIITLQLNDFSILQASQFRLYNPDGSLAIEVQPENGGIGNALLQDFDLDQTGTYSLMVSDVGGNDTGDYVFTLESVNTPGNSVPINYGESIESSLEVASDLDHYTFNGTEGDIITLQLNDFSILQASQFRLYNPDGSLAIEVQPENGGIGNALLQDFDLDQTGTYSLMVSDVGGNDTGDYVFTLESVNTPGNSVPINYGESIESSLEVASDLDHYTFNGTEGDIITLQLNDFSILQASQFRLYNPDGSLAIEVQPENGGIGNALLQDFDLDQTGTYSLMVSDIGGNDTGEYTLSLYETSDSDNNPPTLVNPIPDQIADEDTLFEFQFATDTFNDADGDILTYTTTPLPDWLMFDEQSRTFSGTPENDDVGAIPITVTSSDGNGGVVGTTFDLTVNNTNDAPTLETELPDQAAIVNQSFTFIIPTDVYFQDVDDGVDPNHTLTLNATLENGDPLPDWLTFTTSIFALALFGTPTVGELGTFSIEVIATDNEGETVSDIFELQVLSDDTILGTDNDDDFLEGTPADDTIDGLAGDDRILGHWGDDDLIGGLGDDEIFGNWGDDRLEGNTGDDHLFGNWGDDLLDGGPGNDELKGGPGNDRFILAIDNGLNTILDYQDGQDKFVLNGALTFGQLSVNQKDDDVLLSIAATDKQLALLKQTTVSQVDISDFVML